MSVISLFKDKINLLLIKLGIKNDNSIFYIGGSDVLPPPLEAEEEAQLMQRFNGCQRAVYFGCPHFLSWSTCQFLMPGCGIFAATGCFAGSRLSAEPVWREVLEVPM